MQSVQDKMVLSNGYQIPCVAYGTWKVPEGEVATNCVKHALELGYRHIDTAYVYQNEKSVGVAVKESSVKREEIFVTTKLWNNKRGYDNALWAFEKSLQTLQMEYVDLYLVHWPAVQKQFDNYRQINKDTWRAMIEIYKSGRAKAIGVCNFLVHHINDLMDMEFAPMVNQIEFHPGYMQKEIYDFCIQNGILVEAWSPLGRGRVFDNPTLIEMAQKYNKSLAQICIKWCLQNSTLPLPKSVTPSRIEENMNVFDFEISKEDMQIINALPMIGESGLFPDEVDF